MNKFVKFMVTLITILGLLALLGLMICAVGWAFQLMAKVFA